jgi:glycosyltransferase involved in cell wall biosynthesis
VSGSAAPLVSVVIPAYKAEEFIEEAIGSIRQQEHRPIEVVVVEDCSPDGTAAIVERLAAEWSGQEFVIRLLRQPENRGGAAALARGFAEARGAYLCWLSADDAFVGTTKLGEQIEQLSKRRGVSYATSYYRGPSAARLTQDDLVTAMWDPARAYMEWIMRLFPRARLIGLLFRNPINGSTVMIDRATWERSGSFDAILGNIDQDSDVWMRYSALGVRVSNISSASGFYRIHSGQTSNLQEDCVIGAAARRIRLVMAYEQTGRLPQLLRRTWPILALVHRWEWYVERPLAADYLCEAGLRVSRCMFVRRFLKKIQAAVATRGIADPRLAEAARAQAAETYESREFQAFIRRLSGR